jgi:hypothetical protein
MNSVVLFLYILLVIVPCAVLGDGWTEIAGYDFELIITGNEALSHFLPARELNIGVSL